MLKKILVLLPLFISLQACAIDDQQQKKLHEAGRNLLNQFKQRPLTTQEIASGLKQALEVGAKRVIDRLGQKNGYLNNRAVHIPLTPQLKQVHNTLKKVDLQRYTEELEVKMNRAAELAAPRAKQLFWNAIRAMRWQDVQAIYKGSNDAATRYFKRKMTPELRKMMRPLIHRVLAEAGAVQVYKQVVDQYHRIPFVPRLKNNLDDYVLTKSISGIFYYLAKEEAAIRKNPAKRTTELLRRVFG